MHRRATWRGWGGLLVAGLLAAGCGAALPTPAGILAGVVATATVPAIHLPTYDPNITVTVQQTNLETTPIPTLLSLATMTQDAGRPSAPATNTPRPSTGGGSFVATAVPTGLDPAPDTSAFGVTATFGLEANKATYQRGEKVWFDFTLKNLAAVPLTYGEVGVILPDGTFHTSLSGSSLAGNEQLSWRDWVAFASSGDQSLVLAICFSAKDECRAGGTWVNASTPALVHIQ